MTRTESDNLPVCVRERERETRTKSLTALYCVTAARTKSDNVPVCV